LLELLWLEHDLIKELTMLTSANQSMRMQLGMALIAAFFSVPIAGSRAWGQSSKIRVVSTEGAAIPYAWVSVQGSQALVTDENGEVALGTVHHKTFTVEVRRIGYAPWMGPVVFPDTAAVIGVSLARVAQQLGSVTVMGEHIKNQLALTGFYDRVLMRQKGVLSATFVGPEEIEQRHAARFSDLLEGRLGVALMHTSDNKVIARGIGGMCFMTILLDGNRVCPPAGCNIEPSSAFSANRAGDPAVQAQAKDAKVDLNQYIDVNDVAAIEIYARGGNMPVSLQAADNSCGVIAIWTGARR
jgi:hypothetical protein